MTVSAAELRKETRWRLRDLSPAGKVEFGNLRFSWISSDTLTSSTTARPWLVHDSLRASRSHDRLTPNMFWIGQSDSASFGLGTTEGADGLVCSVRDGRAAVTWTTDAELLVSDVEADRDGRGSTSSINGGPAIRDSRGFPPLAT